MGPTPFLVPRRKDAIFPAGYRISRHTATSFRHCWVFAIDDTDTIIFAFYTLSPASRDYFVASLTIKNTALTNAA